MRRIILATFLLMTIGLQIRLWTGEGSFAHVSGLQEVVDKKSAANRRKSRRNEILKAEVLDLRNGLDALEEKARSELGLIMEGETFYLVLDDKRW
ncbi:MAG: septum formation initiator family protein [Pseudomonadales bacterium]|jgi:cell division protein FtsB